MPQTPAWYPGKPDASIEDDADARVAGARRSKAVAKTTVTCPSCGFRKEETMAESESVHFYTCTHCGKVLKPIFGDCCVFCSYGTVMCPSEQKRALSEASDSIRRYVGNLGSGGKAGK
jgi:hypothetical protein